MYRVELHIILVGSVKKFLALSGMVLLALSTLLIINIPTLDLPLANVTLFFGCFLLFASISLFMEATIYDSCQERVRFLLALIAGLFVILSCSFICIYNSIPFIIPLINVTITYKTVGMIAMLAAFVYSQLSMHYPLFFK